MYGGSSGNFKITLVVWSLGIALNNNNNNNPICKAPEFQKTSGHSFIDTLTFGWLYTCLVSRRLATCFFHASVLVDQSRRLHVLWFMIMFIESTSRNVTGKSQVALHRRVTQTLSWLQHSIYTVFQKEWTTKLMVVTLSNLNQFSQFFYC